MTPIEQRTRALRRANELRLAGAALCRELRAQPRSEALERVAELLIDPPPEIRHYEIARFLRLAIARVGVDTAYRLLAHAEIRNPQRRIGPRSNGADPSLCAPQRERLAAVLIKRANGRPG